MEDLPIVKVRGTHREIGQQMGSSQKDRIQRMIEDWVDKPGLLLFYQSEGGRRLTNRYLETCTKFYPQFVEEIEGLAQGADVQFTKLFLAHLVTEIQAFDRASTDPFIDESCTDLILLTDHQSLLVHTEDTPANVANSGYMVEATITSSSSSPSSDSCCGEPLEEFVSYCYPGLLPGTAFNINKHSVCTSLNIFRQNDVFTGGIPRRFMARAMLTAKSVEEAQTIAQMFPGFANGFNYNMAYVTPDGEYKISSLEMAGTENGSLVHRTDHSGFGQCYNNYRYLSDIVSYKFDTSTFHREERVRQITSKSPPTRRQDLLDIVSDVENRQFPIYRNGLPPDTAATAASCSFDLREGVLDIYRRRPSNSKPVYSYCIRDRQQITN